MYQKLIGNVTLYKKDLSFYHGMDRQLFFKMAAEAVTIYFSNKVRDFNWWVS